MDGRGIVWAMPENKPFPEPDECPMIKVGEFWELPKPPGALDKVMDAIEGDGSILSYLSASIFSREINEFGAFGHMNEWNNHWIIGSDWTIKKREFLLAFVFSPKFFKMIAILPKFKNPLFDFRKIWF